MTSCSLETPLSISLAYTTNPENVRRVIERYKAEDKPTSYAVAEELGTTYHNVRQILSVHLTPEEFKAEKALRYSRSKAGALNPMLGKSGSLHHNYKGSASDHKGYLTEPNGKGGRVFQHRLVLAQALGLEKLPSEWHVHHIDGDTTNNHPDNLALVTAAGHKDLHQRKPKWSRLPLWHQWESGISRSREITPT